MRWLITPGDRRVPLILLAAYVPLFAWSAWEPFGYDIWYADRQPD